MKSWPKKPLASLGPAADGDWILKENYTADGVRLIQVGDIGEGKFIGKSSRFISLKRAKELQCSFLKAGDILISRMPDPLGRACIFPGLDCPAITAVDVAIFRPDPGKAIPRFINYFLNSKPWFDEVLRYATGTTRQRISRTRLEQLELPVPPLAEQERLLALLDQANELLGLRAHADIRTSALIPALFHEMFGDPASNPLQWDRCVLGDLIHAAQDGPHVSPKYAGTGVPFLSTRHIKQGRVIWEDLKFLSQADAEIHWRKCKPEKGDVLYTKGGHDGACRSGYVRYAVRSMGAHRASKN